MFSFFQSTQYEQVNFENVQYALRNSNKYCLINTLPLAQQNCLIEGTINALEEETIINEMLHNFNIPDKQFIVYGKNYTDFSTHSKVQQLQRLGVKDTFVYGGGLFEWMLLQDVYGNQDFPTTTKELDLLQYKCKKCKNI